jgi:phosphatidylserine decarboxylase
MTQAPEYTECPDSTGAEKPCGLIGFPINALIDWPMGTNFGYIVFANALVNQQFKKILGFWSEFLVSEASRSVLIDSFPDRTPKVLAWLSPTARQEMVDVACQASDDPTTCRQQPFEHFFNCDPSDEYYGFKSWDDFFTRTFVNGIRPVAPGNNVIANACESAPLQVVHNVSDTAEFWLKGQPYSLENMMNFDPLAEHFTGGTVYQAFLSALSYHRWNSPVSGRVKKAFVVNGSYYLENRYQGFINPNGADPSAPNDSQPFLTAVATRAVIFIEADNPNIGLMCFIAVGMAEVSSCEITVAEGQHLDKGQELGMFHFGGSTHCLVFGPHVNLDFDFHNTCPGLNATNIPVRSQIATVTT